MSTDSRDKFEKWWEQRYCLKWNVPIFDSLKRIGDRYANGTVHEQWEAWQAALSHQAPAVAVSELEGLLSDASNAIDYMMDVDVIEATKVRTLINKAGSDE